MTIWVYPFTSLVNLIKTAKLLPIKVLICFKKDFNGISIIRLSFPVGHLVPSGIFFVFRSFGSNNSMISLFRVFIVDFIVLDL